MKIKTIAVILSMVLLLGMTSCGAVDEQAAVKTANFAEQETKEQETAESTSYTVTHAFGETTLTQKPERVVSIS